MLLLESDIYGYYIHGQSVHGRSDTGLRQMHENMVQEEVCNSVIDVGGRECGWESWDLVHRRCQGVQWVPLHSQGGEKNLGVI